MVADQEQGSRAAGGLAEPEPSMGRSRPMQALDSNPCLHFLLSCSLPTLRAAPGLCSAAPSAHPGDPLRSPGSFSRAQSAARGRLDIPRQPPCSPACGGGRSRSPRCCSATAAGRRATPRTTRWSLPASTSTASTAARPSWRVMTPPAPSAPRWGWGVGAALSSAAGSWVLAAACVCLRWARRRQQLKRRPAPAPAPAPTTAWPAAHPEEQHQGGARASRRIQPAAGQLGRDARGGTGGSAQRHPVL
jgi:hypothetical protein